ncbi:hypothetical protein [Priestia endophytica]|nr:hypothetical protein [Priestia endophytica]
MIRGTMKDSVQTSLLLAVTPQSFPMPLVALPSVVLFFADNQPTFYTNRMVFSHFTLVEGEEWVLIAEVTYQFS